MLRPMVVGSAAGALATLPMSGLIWGARRVGIFHRTPAPEAVATRLVQRVTGRHATTPPQRQLLTALAHLGFGSGAGAVYGTTAWLRPPTVWSGMLFGLAVWIISYQGWIPALRLLPAPADDEHGRAATMAGAHLVYGGTLGVVSRRLLHGVSERP
jgi:hypothetical protein